MAARMVAVVLVVLTSGAMGLLVGCRESTYRPDAPSGNDSSVWLYVYKNSFFSLHSGIGTRGGYWAYGIGGLYTEENYSHETCNGPLYSWHRLGRTNKTKEEVQAIVSELMNTCYPGYSGCWRFISDHYRLINWNCNYFTHHLAAALGVVDNYPGFLWRAIPGVCLFC